MGRRNSLPPVASQIKAAFAERLHRLREGYGHGYLEMAEKLGIDKEAYRKYERGVNEPPLFVLDGLHRHFGVSLDFLISGNNEKTVVPLRRRPIN
jgi:transcriptional regulator with XRE-family HTH domain